MKERLQDVREIKRFIDSYSIKGGGVQLNPDIEKIKKFVQKVLIEDYEENLRDGAQILFEDGHSEFWSDSRLKSELLFNGIGFLKEQIRLHKNWCPCEKCSLKRQELKK